MSTRLTYATALALLLSAGIAGAGVVDQLLADYRQAGAGPFDPADGAALWRQEHPGAEGPRACTTCHTADPTAAGRHATTGKSIPPIAPSVRPQRLTDRKEVEKWLARNCKWTLGRECSAQEKGDLLVFPRTQ